MTLLTLADAQLLPPGQLKQWAYNGLDVTGTHEIAGVLGPRLSPNQAAFYAFERALQAPSLSMMLRGVPVDAMKRSQMISELKRELKRTERDIANDPLIKEKWDGVEKNTGLCPGAMGKHHKWPRGVPDDDPAKVCLVCGGGRWLPTPFNSNSSEQRSHFLYDLLRLPPQSNKDREITADSDAMVRLAKDHPFVRPLLEQMIEVVDLKKQLGFLEAPLTADNRYMSTFNVGAAWTGRFSSSKNPKGLGGNLQNIGARHRRIFIADYGKEMFYADYMQGESNLVAHLSGDERYIEAHAVGDVHTYVTRYLWPELPWTGDLARDKKIAKQNPPWDLAEGHDYRFQCKRIQHGSNYGLTPTGISMIAQIPHAAAKAAYERYMTEFPGIPAWQNWVYKRVAEMLPLTNPLGRTITLLGRPWDKHTRRQGLAFLPQSALADIENIALWRVWAYLEEEGVELFAQVHDALLGQYPQGRLDLVRAVLQQMQVPIPITDIRGITRTLTIGVEAAVGKNWGHRSADNPHGIDEAPIAEYLRENPL